MTDSAATSEQRATVTQALVQAGAIAVIRLDDADRLLRVAEALLAGGVTAIEVTMTVPNALAGIERLAGTLGDEILLGVGSATTTVDARQAIEAGARYVVSPIFEPAVIREAHRHGCPAMPGTFTPTEAFHAHQAGADLLKVFPADIVGPAYIKAVKAPMPFLHLVPTGGVTPDNAGDWIRAGAAAVGVGSALLDKRAIADGDWAVLTEKARRLQSSIAEARAHR